MSLHLGDSRSASRVGLLGAMVTRVLPVLSLAWIVKLTTPLFTALGHYVKDQDDISRK